MIKDTKVKKSKPIITLIFSLNKKNTDLNHVLDSIARQNDKNANLIFVFNDCNKVDKNTFKTFDFSKFCNVDYIFVSEYISEIYISKYIQKNGIDTKYFYYCDLNIILNLDFISTINNFMHSHKDIDILSFNGVPNIFFNNEYIQIKNMDDIICNQSFIFLQNVILSYDFITKQKNDIHLFKAYTTYHYLQLFTSNPNWFFLGKQLCSLCNKSTCQFNIMDLFDQCDKIIDLPNNNSYFKNLSSELEYVCIVTLLINFVFTFIQNNRHNFILQKRILLKVFDYLNQMIPNWQMNKWLISTKNKNDKSYLNYLRYFKPKLRYVLKPFRLKLQILGYETKK